MFVICKERFPLQSIYRISAKAEVSIEKSCYSCLNPGDNGLAFSCFQRFFCSPRLSFLQKNYRGCISRYTQQSKEHLPIRGDSFRFKSSRRPTFQRVMMPSLQVLVVLLLSFVVLFVLFLMSTVFLCLCLPLFGVLLFLCSFLFHLCIFVICFSLNVLTSSLILLSVIP